MLPRRGRDRRSLRRESRMVGVTRKKFKLKVFFSLGTKYGSNADGRGVNTFYGSSKSGQKILGDCLTREHDGTYSSCSENGNRVDLASIPKRK